LYINRATSILDITITQENIQNIELRFYSEVTINSVSHHSGNREVVIFTTMIFFNQSYVFGLKDNFTRPSCGMINNLPYNPARKAHIYLGFKFYVASKNSQTFVIKDNFGSSGVPVEVPRCSVCLMRTFPLRTVDQAESVGTGV
jgi:hypothetical protein